MESRQNSPLGLKSYREENGLSLKKLNYLNKDIISRYNEKNKNK